MPLIAEYIKQKLLNPETLNQHLNGPIKEYFSKVFSDVIIREMMEKMELDYFELLSYVNYFNNYTNIATNLLEQRDKFTTLKII